VGKPFWSSVNLIRMDTANCVTARHQLGAQIALHSSPVVEAALTLHPQHQQIAAHVHDWPCLTLFVSGGYREESDAGEHRIDGPAAVLHPPGRDHADQVGAKGLETVVLAFEPRWFAREFPSLSDRSSYFVGGSRGRRAIDLAKTWLSPESNPVQLAVSTERFLRSVTVDETTRPAPRWIDRVHQRLRDPVAELPTTEQLAEILDLHPGWLAQAYRHLTGEGLHETLRRRRVEYAAQRLRDSSDSLADIAADAGFCDQSHMNRAFRQVLLRTPAQIRRQSGLLQLAAFAPKAHNTFMDR
jgi:AraC family transcriptional regulator